MASKRKLSANWETIDTKLAEHYLATGDNFRKLNEMLALRYSQYMEDDEWDVTGEPIQFNAEGSLVNGQHRLTAITLSGKPQQFLVVRGIESDRNMDVGKRRTFSDLIGSDCEGVNAPVLAAVVRMAYIGIKAGEPTAGVRKCAAPSMSALDDLFISDADSFIGAARIAQNCSVITKSAAAWLIWAATDSIKAAEFVRRTEMGVNLSDNDPAYLLRERILRERVSRKRRTRRAGVGSMIKAYNAWVTGTGVKRIVFRSSTKAGRPAEPFPKVL